MNCKEGDLAIIVKSLAGNEGKIVRCVKFVGTIPKHIAGWSGRHDFWLLDQSLNHALVNTVTGQQVPNGAHPYAPDAYLRPLRGDLLDDEETQTKELSHVD